MNATFVENHAGFVGGAIAGSGAGSQSELMISNTLIANNTADNIWGIQQNCTRNLVDGGGNLQYPARTTDLFNDYECVLGLPAGTDPQLGSFGDHGGPTHTFALLAGSIAIDAGNQIRCPAVDQRGHLRDDERCDIGAYEVGATPLNLVKRMYLTIITR